MDSVEKKFRGRDEANNERLVEIDNNDSDEDDSSASKSSSNEENENDYINWLI